MFALILVYCVSRYVAELVAPNETFDDTPIARRRHRLVAAVALALTVLYVALDYQRFLLR